MRAFFLILILLPLTACCQGKPNGSGSSNFFLNQETTIMKPDPAPMSPGKTKPQHGKNIVICLDGTNNEFGQTNTNVVRLFQAMERTTSTQQIVYYDPGVGTLAPPNLLTGWGKAFMKNIDLAFGTGVIPKAEEAIHFLMQNYEPGDQIYIFGFSRGAYTARVVAAILHVSGLPYKGADNQIPYFTRNLKNWNPNDKKICQVCGAFKETFGRPVRIHFLGLWDTVSSVGWIYDPDYYYFTAESNTSVDIMRHAVSLDERRAFFGENLWTYDKNKAAANTDNCKPSEAGDICELLFPGVHSDVGGGYSDGELWKGPLAWMVQEATKAGIEFKDDQAKAIQRSTTEHSWAYTTAHESLHGAWWLGELIPKKYQDDSNGSSKLRLHIPGAHRTVRPGTLLHRSVIDRMRKIDTYRPSNLNPSFISHAIRNEPVTDIVPYLPDVKD